VVGDRRLRHSLGVRRGRKAGERQGQQRVINLGIAGESCINEARIQSGSVRVERRSLYRRSLIRGAGGGDVAVSWLIESLFD